MGQRAAETEQRARDVTGYGVGSDEQTTSDQRRRRRAGPRAGQTPWQTGAGRRCRVLWVRRRRRRPTTTTTFGADMDLSLVSSWRDEAGRQRKWRRADESRAMASEAYATAAQHECMTSSDDDMEQKRGRAGGFVRSTDGERRAQTVSPSCWTFRRRDMSSRVWRLGWKMITSTSRDTEPESSQHSHHGSHRYV